ncbi:hypothetical protein DACRYDRAFT_104996 [Dacryopinax primogenitus]|uniref:Uncharacterized protein n=1 Tax=Dacryopinax primogenitus (strain DJM 731) TaxID=1858805 RepID=M5GE62_DACPD|nr:uncharacterized protein DACRYDRAFT_104996 [Dacryopinax primogenitus]EJU05112.1 hypothetical protein DACRYDRAFT_104996 [Dacryopinax primogenitus]
MEQAEEFPDPISIFQAQVLELTQQLQQLMTASWSNQPTAPVSNLQPNSNYDTTTYVEEQLDLGRHFGTLHKHATIPLPREPGLEEVHVVYADSARKPDPTAFSKIELWHTDVTHEQQRDHQAE